MLLLGLGTWCSPAQAALDPTRDKILYVVSTAHLDTQWNWTIQDTINTCIPDTLTNNFNLFAAYPDYVFSFEGAFRYRLAKEYYPGWYATLTNYVNQGRWRVAGSAVDAGDVNVPSPESLMRQVLYANGFWKSEFGKTSTDIFLPDCFGFGYALPSVAAHCGLSGFSSQKLSWGSAVPIPFQNIGRWIGPDGNSVVAVLQPGSYTSTLNGNLANDLSELSRITNMGAATGLYLDYRYIGTGDRGGSPTAGSVDWLEQSVTTTNGYLNVLSAASDQLFRDLAPSNLSRLPTYQGELLMRTHGTGCYTAHPEMKKYNRENEQRADAAERISVMADWLQGGGVYPQAKLTRAWERFLWHQFHDDLTGTSIPAAYTFSWNDELLSLNEFGSSELQGAGMVAAAMDTSVTGVPVVVYNPLSIARQDVVEATVAFTNGTPAAVRVYDGAGNEVPSQTNGSSGNHLSVLFVAEVPAVGCAVFEVRPSPTPCALDTGLAVTTSQVENAQYRVRLNTDGDVYSIYDKLHNRELLKAPIRWLFLPDPGNSWPAWEIQYSAVTAAPNSVLAGPASIQILENGPARVALGVTRFNAGSAFTERIRLASGEGGDRVEWDVSANWATRQTLLKVAFPLAVTNSSATYDLGLGVIERTNSSLNTYEVPAQQWTDLAASNGAYGVSILDDCRYGWDKPDDSTLRLTVFHTPSVASSFVYQATNGFGTHRFTFALMGHTNDWRSAGTPWAAARLNQPLQPFQTAAHPGTLGKSFGFLICNNPNVMVKALKKAETGNEVVVRLQELSGSPQAAQLSFARPILTARQLNGAEDVLGSLYPAGGTLSVSLARFEPMTLAVTLASPESFVSRPVSVAVALTFNRDAVSTDANRTDGNFDNGSTYPAELLPSSLASDGVTFQLGPTNDGALNALACQGQAISLPAGYDQVYLLASAASNDITAPFLIDGQPTNLTIPYFSGFVGQWTPPYLKQAEVGWVCTHRHSSAGKNEAYTFCYLFKERIALPAGATTLTLPNSPNIRIFAISVARNAAAQTLAAGPPLSVNQLPWAVAGPDRKVSAATNGLAVVQLDGSASVDPDGTIVSYAWSEDGTNLATTMKPAISLPVGVHTIALTVTDDQGGASQDPFTITVLAPLNVSFTAAPSNGLSAPLTVQFTAQVTGGSGNGPVDTTDDQTGVVSAQGQNSVSGEVAANAFDNDAGTKWLDFANANPATRASWIQYQYAGGQRFLVTSYTITSANDYPDRDPAAWRLLGSNDGGTSWITLDTRTNQLFSSRFQKRSFGTTNTVAYNLYRVQIDRVANPASANSVQLAELEFIGNPDYNFWWSFGDGATSTLPNPQHTFAAAGSYLVTLAASYGLQTGTNTGVITIGPPLTASVGATPLIGTAPLTVQFQALADGGNGVRAPYSTTDDGYGTVSAQGENPPNETAVRAFDNSVSTKWLDFASAFPETRSSWIQYRYANNIQCVVSNYTLTSANDSAERDPADWELLASNDGGGTWTTLDTRIGQVFSNRLQTLSYTPASIGPFNLYRLRIDRVFNPTNANAVQLAELELIGRPEYSYLWLFGDGSAGTGPSPTHTYMSNGVYTVSLLVSDGAATVARNLEVSVQTLSLAISFQGTQQAELTWPAWATNWNLYFTTNLAPAPVWSLVTNVPAVAEGTNFTVTLPIGAGNRFFQLRQP